MRYDKEFFNDLRRVRTRMRMKKKYDGIRDFDLKADGDDTFFVDR